MLKLLAKFFKEAKSNPNLLIEKNRLDRIIGSVSDGIIWHTPNFTIQLFNRAAEKIFNVSNQETIGKKFSPKDAQSLKFGVLAKVIFQSLAPTVVRQTPEGEYPQIVDISFDEPRLELRVTTEKILNDKGEALGFLKIIWDRTREIEFIKSKSNFITVAAHQLRTPLSAVIWAFQSLQNEKLNNSQKELAETGQAAAKSLLKIVEDLLSVAKIEEGQFGYSFQSVDLVSFLQSTIERALPVALEYGVKIYLDVPPEFSLPVFVDPEKLGLAVANLFENAIKYNVKNGEVVVKINRQPNTPFVQISIKDTGMGIVPEDLKKMFRKFFRSEDAISKDPGGSGLGLYIVKNIIKRHGGDIWAESELDRGTTFYFVLPTDQKLIPQKEIAYGEW